MRIQSSNEILRFAAPLGGRVLWTTGFMYVLLGGVLLGTLFMMGSSQKTGVYWILTSLSSLMALSVGLRIREYRLEKGFLVVDFLLFRRKVPLSEIEEAKVGESQVLKGAWRLFGNGGWWCMGGWFRNSRLGLFRALVSDPKRPVVLKRGKRFLVISPEDPQGFVDAIHPRIGGTVGLGKLSA